ncbi:hypothetical protein LUZ60_017477 [Juncus effusus]|nr:hypothetical protein LUZ60_017477 [Juncus effusus]
MLLSRSSPLRLLLFSSRSRSLSSTTHLLSRLSQAEPELEPEAEADKHSTTATHLVRPDLRPPFHLSGNRGLIPPYRGIGYSGAALSFARSYSLRVAKVKKPEFDDESSQRAVNTALWCNFLVFSLKFGVYLSTTSHVMLAELVHSIADFANQALLAYGLSSSRRAPDAMHPYGYSKERFVWSLISAVGIFCLGSGATIVHGIQNLWSCHPPENIHYAALVIGGSFLIEGASLLVAINAVKKGAAAEGMNLWDYIWRGHDPTSVAVMTEDGAACTGLAIAAASLVAVQVTGNPIYDPIGSIIVGNLLGMFREAAKSTDDAALLRVMANYGEDVVEALGFEVDRLESEIQKIVPGVRHVVDALYDCKSKVIGPGFFRFKAEIDFKK